MPTAFHRIYHSLQELFMQLELLHLKRKSLRNKLN